MSKEDELAYMNVTPLEIQSIKKILDYLVENENYIAQFNTTRVIYKGTYMEKDGKVQYFVVERRVKDE